MSLLLRREACSETIYLPLKNIRILYWREIMPLLNTVLIIICFNEGLCRRNPVFDTFLQDPDHSRNHSYEGSESEESYDDDYEDETYESGLVDENEFNVTAVYYYEEALRDAIVILGEHTDMIVRVKQALGLLDSEENHEHQELGTFFQTAKDLIVEKGNALQEKLFSEIFHKNMTDPLEKSTIDSLAAVRKKSIHAIDNLQPNEEMEELKKWIENTNNRIFEQYERIESLMKKVKEKLSDSHNHEQKQE